MPRQLNIAVLCPGYPATPEDYRGPFVKTMIDHLKQRGHKITVITPRVFKDNPAYTKIDELEEIYRFPFWTEGKLLPDYEKIPYARLATYFTSGIINAVKIIRSRRCEIIHAHFLIPTGIMGALIGKITGLPLVITAHGPETEMALRNPVSARLSKWALRRSDIVMPVADHVTKKCKLLGASPDKIIKIPMGIDADAFWDNDSPEERGSEKKRDKIIISTRSFLEPQYNVIQLIEALPLVFSRDNDVRCVLAGAGPEKDRLKRRVKELGIEDRVNFIGKQSPPEIAHLLNASIVYVSTSRFDGASVSLFEAMASGTFPVVTDIEANREWVTHGKNGFMVGVGDCKNLAEQIFEALSAHELRRQAASINREIIQEKVLWSRTIPQVEDAFLKLVRE
jgi:L-malate glycosyltransferase